MGVSNLNINKLMNKISTKIVADSISPTGKRITTMELIMPRFILAEFNTHRVFSRNSASSRAIPFKKMVKMVQEEPFIPIAWQKDHSGMQGTEYFTSETIQDNPNYFNIVEHSKEQWLKARDKACEQASILNNAGVTKQLCNRLLEPFMYHKVLVTATEWENFFNLRCPVYSDHKGNNFKSKKEYINFEPNMLIQNDLLLNTDLDWLHINKGQGEIHIMDLAEKMYDVLNESTPKQLKVGEWHIPYGDNIDLAQVNYDIILEHINKPSLLEAKIATARCARLSYQTLGDNPKIDYEADLKLFDILYKSGHFSPFEHCAVCMENNNNYANFKGFKQYRTFLEEK